jgi:hypothetical protein
MTDANKKCHKCHSSCRQVSFDRRLVKSCKLCQTKLLCLSGHLVCLLCYRSHTLNSEYCEIKLCELHVTSFFCTSFSTSNLYYFRLGFCCKSDKYISTILTGNWSLFYMGVCYYNSENGDKLLVEYGSPCGR